MLSENDRVVGGDGESAAVEVGVAARAHGGFLFVVGEVILFRRQVLVWRDHDGLFPWAGALPQVAEATLLAFVVPLLALPQVTHYLIDGFIWKMRKADGDLKKMVE